MKIDCMRRIPDLTVNLASSGRELLANFRTRCPEIRRARVPVFRQRAIAVEIIRFPAAHRIDAALRQIRDMKDRRFLDPYELLVLDDREPELQMRAAVATHEFVLGMDLDDVPNCASRDHFGRIVESAESWQGRMMPASTWYATVKHVTDVDRIDVDAVLDSTDYEKNLDVCLKELYPNFVLK